MADSWLDYVSKPATTTKSTGSWLDYVDSPKEPGGPRATTVEQVASNIERNMGRGAARARPAIEITLPQGDRTKRANIIGNAPSLQGLDRATAPTMDELAWRDNVDWRIAAPAAGLGQNEAYWRSALGGQGAIETDNGVAPPPRPDGSLGSIATGLGTGFRGALIQMREGGIVGALEHLPLLPGETEMSRRARVGEHAAKYDAAGNYIADNAPNFPQVGNDLYSPTILPNWRSDLYGAVNSAVQSSPAIVTGIATGAATANPYIGMAAGLGVAGMQTGGTAYGKYHARGATPGEALAGAALEGGIEVATELLPMGTIVNKFGKAGASKFIADLLGKEMAGEQVATFTQDAVDTAIANPNKTWGEFMAERPNAAYQTALAVLVQSGAVGAASHVTQRIGDHLDANGRLAARNPTDTRTPGPGIAEQAIATAAQPTPDDIASPLDTQDIVGGRVTIAESEATNTANQALSAANLPPVGSRVAITMPDGSVQHGTMGDVHSDESGSGVVIQKDDGKPFREYFDTLNETGTRIEALSPEAEAMAQAQAVVDEVNAGLPPLELPSQPAQVEVDTQAEPARAPAPVKATAAPASQGGTIASYMGKVRGVESGGSDTAKNPLSSATGRYQFTNGTWLATYKQVFGASGKTDAQILAERGNGDVQDRLMRKLTEDNAAGLKAGGFDISEANLYLAHFAGIGGARKILGAKPDEPIANVLGQDVVNANPFLKGKSASEVVAWAAKKMGAAAPASSSAVAVAESNTSTPQPDEALPTTDYGKSSAAAPSEQLPMPVKRAGDEVAAVGKDAIRESAEDLQRGDAVIFTDGSQQIAITQVGKDEFHLRSDIQEGYYNGDQILSFANSGKFQRVAGATDRTSSLVRITTEGSIPSAPVAPSPTPQARIEATASGKGIAVFDATPAQLAAISAALPQIKGTPRSDGAVTYSKKYEDEIRTALDKAQVGTGETKGKEWSAFPADSGTLGIPRAEMPQIKAEHRGAMVNFLNARGIEHSEVTVPSGSLKPSQAEFSSAKVRQAMQYEGGDRAILISQDGHVVDGHHQWMAAISKGGEDVRAIKLHAPIREVIAAAHEFPSSTTADGATEAKPEFAQQTQQTLGNKADDTYTAADVGGMTKGLADTIARTDGDPKAQETILDAIDRGLIRDGDMLAMGNPRWALERGYADIGPVDGTRRGRITEKGKARLAELRGESTAPRDPKQPIGKNHKGHPVYEDENGVRSFVENGIRITEPVELRPTREGIRTSVNPDARETRFLTDAERQAKMGAKPSNGTAPEHAQIGVDDRELAEIVAEFNDAQASMLEGDEQVTHVFDPPAKGEVVRLADKVKVYHAEHGWMTPAEAATKIAEWKAHAEAQGGPGSKNSDKVVLSLFDLSGEWSKPWEDAGYQVYRFDIQDDPEVGDVHNFSTEFFGDWFGDFDGQDIYAILAATPCTDFASSGARHFAAKDADGRTVASVKLVHQTLATIEYFKPAVWAIENPVGRIEKLGGLPPWRLSFDPNHIGETYTKKTLLWGRFNGNLPIAPVDPVEGSKMHTQYGGKSQATKNARSVTPEGFAYSFFMANNATDNPAMAIAGKYDRLDRGLIERAVKAGVTEDQINNAVEDFYYQELDDDAANAAIRDLIGEASPPSAPTRTTPSQGAEDAKPARVRNVGKKKVNANPTLIEWIADRGGIWDGDGQGLQGRGGGGNLKAIGLGDWHNKAPFRRKAIRDPKLGHGDRGIDNTLTDAIEAGFFPELEGSNGGYYGQLDSQILIDALNAELAGKPRYSKHGHEPVVGDTRTPDEGELEAYAEWIGEVAQQRFGVDPEDLTPALLDRAANIKFYASEGMTDDEAFMHAVNELMAADRANAFARRKDSSYEFNDYDWPHVSENPGEGLADGGDLAGQTAADAPAGVGGQARADSAGDRGEAGQVATLDAGAAVDPNKTKLLNQQAQLGAAAPLQGGSKTGQAQDGTMGLGLFDAVDQPQMDLSAPSDQKEKPQNAAAATAETSPESKADQKSDNAKFANNKLVTIDKLEAARARMRDRMNRLNSGVDPEMLVDGMIIAVAHIEAGVRNFAEFAKAMRDDFGNKITPFLQSFWEGARAYPGLDNTGMTTPDVTSAMLQMMLAEPNRAETPPPTNTPRPVEQAGDSALQALADHFVNGGSFQSIVAARMFVAENTFGMGTIKAGTADAKRADETIEAAIVQAARKIAARNAAPLDTFRALVDLYARQPNLNVRSSTSVEQQAYSTPVPLAYLASRRAGIGQETTVYEPSAGNGALLIDARATYATANELNPDRAAMLRQLYRGATITEQDASEFSPKGQFDAVIANPPFGAVKDEDGEARIFDLGNRYETREIDHAIAMQALASMKDGGRAVLIVGGVNKLARDDKARSDAYNGKAKREFYYRLYSEYNVTDHFTVAGELYAKQGAGWPVDVIVIEGRSKSQLPLPAVSPPRQYASWGELENALDGRPGLQSEAGAAHGSADSQVGRPGGRDGRDSQGGRAGRPDRQQQRPEAVESADLFAGYPIGQPGSGRLDERPAGISAGLHAGTPQDNGNRATGRPAQVTAAAIEGENARQVTYNPASSSKSLDTLVPINMQTAITAALNKLQDAVGKVDDYVADRLGYKPSEIPDYFSAEQVDALALALDNMEKGAGFIIGDQTGIGKGRVVAGIIRYAIKSGRTPIFVTEKPNLYADMYRDMADIGLPEMLGRPVNILMTNAGETVPLDEDGKQTLKTPTASKHNDHLMRVANGDREGVDVVFTNYSQMQTLKGETTPRQAALAALAPGSILIFDESHNAGGQGNKGDERKTKKQKAAEDAGLAPLNRAQFARAIAAQAHGVFFSSATYAKRPDVMDLYASTDMRLAVANIDALAAAITKGGIPMQQVVATMLTEAGQYVRRERSFEGVDYRTPRIEVDRTAYAQFAQVLRGIQQFQEMYIAEAIEEISNDIKADAAAVSHDGSVGSAGAHSTNFTSVMHNLVEQMLVALKAEPAVAMAIKAIESGEKPVITLANTMGSFIQQYADDNNLGNGGEMPSDFRALLVRYLDRTRHYTVRTPFSSEKGEKKYISDQELSSDGLAAYNAVLKQIEGMALQDVPISPIDHIRNRLEQAGYKVGEITGRTHTIDYSGGFARLRIRPGAEKSIAGKLKAMSGFNNGTIDAMILNQSGSTGLSLHASEKFKDQRPRRMIIAQAERNIDTHMQMLGRIHRTGQVVLPSYDQLVAAVPAELRPAAVLAKKMASLNANTTGARGSAMMAEDVPDFMNEYGDEIAARMMEEDPLLYNALLKPLTTSKGNNEGLEREDAARKVTGKLTLMPLEEQEAFYETFLSEYRSYLAEKEAAGEAALEAKTLDLDAKLVEGAQVIGPTRSDSPFGAAVDREVFDVKRLGRPMTPMQVLGEVAATIGESAPESADTQALLAIEPKGKAWLRDLYRQRMADFDAYRREVLDGLDKDKLAAHQERLQANAQAFDQLTGFLYPGSRVSLNTPAGFEFHGIVIGLEKKGSTKNPLALGSWRAIIAMADPVRTMTIPLSQLRTDRMPENPTQSDLAPATHAGMVPILQAFEEMQTESREKRTIFTGNILAAFEHTSGKGQIVNFITNDGAVRPGIMMRRGYDYAKEIARQPVPFRTPEQVLQWLRAGETAFADGVKVENDGGRLIVTAAASKAAGGRYFLNAGVRQALGGDFYKKSTGMVAETSLNAAGPVIDALQRAGAVFSAKTNFEKARDIVANSEGAAAPKLSIPADRGESARSSRDLEAVRDALNKQLRALGLEGKVALRIANSLTRFGSTKVVQGSYTPGRRVIEVALDSTDEHSFVLNHEVIHALRDMGLINKSDWFLLQKAAMADKELWRSVNRRYQSLTAEERAEEAVADLFAHYQRDGQTLAGTAGRLIVRIAKFLSAVRNALRGQGFTTSRTFFDVMEEIRTGKMAGREATGDAGMAFAPAQSVADGGVAEGLRQLGERFPDDVNIGISSDFGGARVFSLTSARREMLRQLLLAGEYDKHYDAVMNYKGGAAKFGSVRVEVGLPEALDALDMRRFSIPEREQMVDLAGSDPSYKGQMRERFDRWRTRMQDRYLPLLRVQREIERATGKTLPQRMDPYLGEELMTGRIGARLDVLADDHVEPLLNAMADEKITTDELETYLYARHAPERNARIAEINPDMEGNGSGMTDLEAMAVMKRIERAGQTAAMERLAARVDAIRDMALDMRVEAGLMSQKQADEWRSTYEHYVPLRGFKETGGDVTDSQFAERINRSGGGINVRGRESKPAFGRRSQADSPIAYTILQAEEAIVRGETNRVAQRFINLARAAPDDEFWKVNKVTAAQRINEDTGLVERYLHHNVTAADKDWTVSAKFNGKEVRVTMNRQNAAAVRLADSMKNLTQHQLDWVTEHLGKVNRFLSAVNTSYNPEFVITNAIRDLQTATINLAGVDVKGLEAKVLLSYPMALKASMQGAFGKESGEWGDAYREFTMAGGRVYFNQVENVAEIKQRIEKLAAQASAKSGDGSARLHAKRVLVAFKDAIENANLGVENAVRLATFKAARDAGLSADRAASLAKNVTVNFNRRGTFGPAMNAAYLFYNAGMQGTARIMQAVRSPRVRKMLAGVITTGFLVEMLNAMISGDDDDGESFYDKIPANEKERNFILMIGPSKYIRLPMPYGYNVFWNAGSITAEIMRRGGDRWQESAGAFVGSALNAFNPIGGTNSILNFFSPTILDPVVDLTQNRNFMDRPIMPDQSPYEAPTPDNQRYFGDGPPFWKPVTDFLNAASGGDSVVPGAVDMSPETLEYLAGTVFGAAGAFVQRVAALPDKAMSDEGIGFNDIPFARKVIGDKPGWYDKSAYYDRQDQIEQALAYAKDYAQGGDLDKAQAYVDHNAKVLSMLPLSKISQRQMSELRKAKSANVQAKQRGMIDAATYADNRRQINDAEKQVVTRFNTGWNAAMNGTDNAGE